MIIRDFDPDKDVDGLRRCFVELQDFERRLDPRMPAGDDIADAYIAETLSKCAECLGTMLVADADGEIAGYATILAKVRADELDDGDFEYAYIADLVVRETYRGRGYGRKLIARAETYASDKGARWLRMGALAKNEVARNLYASLGFAERLIELEKDLAAGAKGKTGNSGTVT